jgi:dTDP-4-amino-4,6-dideoxygalactose transaminase
MEPIPHNRPHLVGNEFAYVRQAIDQMHLAGDGDFTRRCHALLETILPGSRVLLTTSMAHALEIAGFALGLAKGDEVLVPAFASSSTVNPFVLRGARPVFVDVQPGTLNMDPAHAATHITDRTKVVVPMHYAGVGCDMAALLALAIKHELHVVEDTTHGLFGSYRDQPLGTFGTFGAVSFRETQCVSCGEGGALIVNDEQYLHAAEIIREKGTNRSQFFRGEVDKYSWVDLGSSYLPSDLSAAFLLAQLEAREVLLAQRMDAWQFYRESLADWANAHAVNLPCVPKDNRHPASQFHLFTSTRKQRDDLIAHLRAAGIDAVFHYQPLHTSPMGERLGGETGACPVAEDVAGRIVRLPLFQGLTRDQQNRVVETLHAFAQW